MFSGFPSVHFKIEATNIKYVRACGLKKLQLLCYFSVFSLLMHSVPYNMDWCPVGRVVGKERNSMAESCFS